MLTEINEIKYAQGLSKRMDKFFEREAVSNGTVTITADNQFAVGFSCIGRQFRVEFPVNAKIRVIRHQLVIAVEDYVFATVADEFHKQMAARGVEEDLTVDVESCSGFVSYTTVVYKDGKKLFHWNIKKSLNIASEVKEILDVAVGYKEIKRSQYRVR